MRVLHRISLAVGLVIGFGANALAADVPSARKVAPVPAVYNWSGLYAGINGGYVWSADASEVNGFAGGGQVGANWQTGQLVFGLEADFQGNTQKVTETLGALSASEKVPWFGTVRGRLGWTADRWLLYVTGGASYSKLTLELSAGGVTVSDSDTVAGYAVGGGTEWAFADRWSTKLEYLYLDTGDTTVTLFGTAIEGRLKNNVVRAGLNYRF